jgi:hypothetical protein
MSQEQAWALEEMARTMQAERLAAAEHHRMVASLRQPSVSPRILLARALRSLAALLDDEGSMAPTPERRLVRAY